MVEIVQSSIVTRNLADQFWNLLASNPEFTDLRIKVVKSSNDQSASPSPSPNGKRGSFDLTTNINSNTYQPPNLIERQS